MSAGGRRPGAGRPLGATTIRSREIANRAIAEGISPLEVMLENMRLSLAKARILEAKLERTRNPIERNLLLKEATKYRAQAQDAAVDAAPYVHPKLAAVQYVEPKQPVYHRPREEILAELKSLGWSDEMLDRLRPDPDDDYVPNHKLSKTPSGSGNGSEH